MPNAHRTADVPPMYRAFRRASDPVQNGVPGQRRANLVPIVDSILAPAREGIKRSWTTLARDAKVISVDPTDARNAILDCFGRSDEWCVEERNQLHRLGLDRFCGPFGSLRVI